MNKLALAIATLALLVAGSAYVFIKPVTTAVDEALSGVAGPDSFYPIQTQNGVMTAAEGKNFSQSSTTLATFKSPNATTTLSIGIATVSTASTTALFFEWGKSSAQDATTTSLGVWTPGASGKTTMMASTSPGAITGGVSGVGDPVYVISPNTYVTLKYGGAVCTTGGACNSLVGRASVEFKR